MKKFLRSKATGKLGVTYVANIVFQTGNIFREIPEDTDLGIDGYIEFINNEISTGTWIGIQIKAGASYLLQYSDAKYFTIRASNKDINYWNSLTIPIALIAYDPETELSGWLDITGFIRNHPESLQQEQTKITIHSKATPFNAETIEKNFKETFSNYRREADLFEYSNMLVSNEDVKKYQGFLGLMSIPKSRYSYLTCYLLIQHLFTSYNPLRIAVTDSLSRYLPNPEFSFNPPKDLRNYILNKLAIFGIDEISQLLETAWLEEENLMQRGSIGQSAGIIITNIPNCESYLYKIVSDSRFTYQARVGALALVMEFSLETVIANIIKNFAAINWGEARDAAEWFKDECDERFYEEEGMIIDILNKEDFNNEYLINYLHYANNFILFKYQDMIYQIIDKTTNPSIKLEAQRALHKINKYNGESFFDEQ